MTNAAESSRARSTGIRLLQWYPRPWRRRYLVEMQALLQQMPVGWRQVANLAAIGVREWLSPRALGWPAREAAGRVQTVRTITYVTCAFALDGVARIIAWKVSAAGITIPDPISTIAGLLMLGLAVRLLTAGNTYRRHQKKNPRTPEAQMPGRVGGSEIALWAFLMVPWLVVRHSEPTPEYLSQPMLTLRPYTHLLSIFVWSVLTLEASARTKRLRRVQASWSKRH